MFKKSALFIFALLTAAGTISAADSAVRIWEDGRYRYIESNGLPDHQTGRFPNRGNPNAISSQSYRFRVALHPQAGSAHAYGHNLFGVALNGVPFDPGTAEFWNNNRNSGWNYEALSGKINLGIDANHAHVQPGGAYHYHGIPEGLIRNFSGRSSAHLVGYAADGFGIYTDPNVHSGYRLKSGLRPSGPGGRYDGTFVQDYEYVAVSGSLDECNGMEFEDETGVSLYRYYLTDEFPFVPRCHKGIADASFRKKNPHSAGADPNGNRKPPTDRKPPVEALSACTGKSEGDSCSFRSPHGQISGTCRQMQNQTACVPDHPPRLINR